VIDIATIVIMVAGRLLRQGMAPRGLWRSLKPPAVLPGRSGSTPETAPSRVPRDSRDATAQ
jgi:hypothetical protein